VAVEHDPTGLAHESNVLRFRPIHDLHVRAGEGASPTAVARVLAAAACCGISPRVSAHPALAALPWRAAGRAVGDVTIEPASGLWQRLGRVRSGRVRLLGDGRPEPDAVSLAVHVDDRPPVASGRVELLRYVREQSVSRTLHRFGNLVLTAPRPTAATARRIP
jgi:RHH-type proline utilization regulon transcriptional repressor/proline dehydrogenase/delta 1-pyrroline-5-carboxylate dehydrogenase